MPLILRKNGLGKGYLKQIAELIGNTRVAKTLRQARKYGPQSILLRWGSLEDFATDYVFNKPEAIRKVSNKRNFRLEMQSSGVSVPKTFSSFRQGVAESTEEDRLFSWIARPAFHSGGEHVLTGPWRGIFNPGDLGINMIEEELHNWPNNGNVVYVSRYIPKDREFRVFVIQGRVVCVAEKIVQNREEIAWNHNNGGSFSNLKFSDWPVKACVEAVKAFKLSGLDFGGVDVIQQGEQPYVLEINSAPTITSRYRQECFAKAFKWAIEQAQGTTEREVPEVLVEKVKGWRRLVHPAISAECRRD